MPDRYPSFSNLPVVELGDTFMRNTTIETVYFPSTITTISKNCFLGCHNLETVYIPSSINTISFAVGITGRFPDIQTSIFPLRFSKKLHIHCEKESDIYLYCRKLRRRHWHSITIETDYGIAYDEQIKEDMYAYCSFSENAVPTTLRLVRILERKYSCILRGSGQWSFYEPSDDRNDWFYSLDAPYLYDCQRIPKEKRVKLISKCRSFVAFIDKTYWTSEYVEDISEAVRLNKPIAIYLLEDCLIPKEWGYINDSHQLRYDAGTEEDRITKLVNWISQKGSRLASNIPDFEFDVSDEGIKILRYLGEENEVIIDETYDGIPVVEIGEGAFWGCNSVTSIAIPSSIIRIGENAFGSCEFLQKVIIDGIPYSLEDIVFMEHKKKLLDK